MILDMPKSAILAVGISKLTICCHHRDHDDNLLEMQKCKGTILIRYRRDNFTSSTLSSNIALTAIH